MREEDLQPPKPLWHEDTRGRGRGNGGGGGRGQGGYNPPAGPISDAGYRMLHHTMQVGIAPSSLPSDLKFFMQ